MADGHSLLGVCEGVDTVFHTACASQETFANGRGARGAFDAVNTQGTLTLAHEALRARVRRVVHLSSTAAVGVPEQDRVDETTPCRPATPYGRSKRAAELGLAALFRERGLPVVILRPCLVAGEGKPGSELTQLLKLVRWGVFPFPGGRARQGKPLVHLDDLLNAVELAAARGRPGEIYLITSGRTYALEDIVAVAGRLLKVRRTHIAVPMGPVVVAARVMDSLGRVLPVSFPLSRERLRFLLAHREFSIDKARAELGYEPRVVDLEPMLAEVVCELTAGKR